MDPQLHRVAVMHVGDLIAQCPRPIPIDVRHELIARLEEAIEAAIEQEVRSIARDLQIERDEC